MSKTLVAVRYNRSGKKWVLDRIDITENYTEYDFRDKIISEYNIQFFKTLGGKEITVNDYKHHSISPDGLKKNRMVSTIQ